MSQLRAPEARPERREGGRHGRPGARSHSATARPRAAQPSPEARIRPQLLRTAVLPTVVAVLSGAAAVIFTARSGARLSGELWIALGVAGALALAAVLAAYLAANRVATTVFGRCLALRRTSAQGQAELQRVVEQLRNGEPVSARRSAPPSAPGSDAFELLAQELGRQQEAAVAAVVQASRLSDNSGEDQKVEVFVNLARSAPVAGAPRDPAARRAGARGRGPRSAQGPLPRRPSRHPHPAGTPRISRSSAAPSPGGSGATRSP